MSRKNKTEKACSAVWKDQSTMAAVAKQKTAQEGQASQGCGDTGHQRAGVSVTSHDQTAAETRPQCCCPVSVGSSHEVEASGDMTVRLCEDHGRTDLSGLSEEDMSSMHADDIPEMSCLSCEEQVTTAVDTESHDKQTFTEPDTRETVRVMPSQNCYPSGDSGQESLTSPLDMCYGSGSIRPIFELECDGTSDDDVFDAGYRGDDDDDDDQSRGDRPEHSYTTHASQPVDIPRLVLSPHAAMHASPNTRLFLLPPGGSVPSQHRLAIGSLMCGRELSISGQSPLGPDNIMVHEALAWTQRLLTPMQQVGDDPPRARFTSFSPAQTSNLMTSRDRSQSAPSVMSRSVLERQFGRELRRISDEFHFTYGMGQLRHAHAPHRINGHRPASFPCNHGNQPGWWQLVLAYWSPRQLNHHRRCILEQPTDASNPSDPSLAERDQEEDEDLV